MIMRPRGLQWLILGCAFCLAAAGEAQEIQPVRLVTPEGHIHPPMDMRFSPDGHYLATMGLDRSTRIWDVGSGREVRRLPGHETGGQAIAQHSIDFSADGVLLATGGPDLTIRVSEVGTGRLLRLLHTPMAVHGLAFLAGRRHLLTVDSEATRLWEIASGYEIRRFRGHATSAAVSPDGLSLLTANADGIVRLWNLGTGAVVREYNLLDECLLPTRKFADPECTIRYAMFSADGRSFRTGGPHSSPADNEWELASGRRVTRESGTVFRPAPGAVAGIQKGVVRATTFALAPDGRHALEAVSWVSPDLGVHDLLSRDTFWLTAERISWPFLEQGYDTRVITATFSPDARYLATSHVDATIRLWDLSSREEVRVFRGYSWGTHFAKISPDGQHVLSWGESRRPQMWELASGRLVRTIAEEFHWDASRAERGVPQLNATFSADGRLALIQHMQDSSDAKTRLWDLTTNLRVPGVPACRGDALSPDGSLVVGSCRRAATADGTLQVWSPATGTVAAELVGHTGEITSAAFSHDGRLILTTSADSTARVWDARSGRQVRSLTVTFLSNHPAAVNVGVFSSDSKLAVTGGDDGSVRIWDVSTGEELRALIGHEHPVLDAAFQANRRIVTVSREPTGLGEVRVWDAETGTSLRTFTVVGDGGQPPYTVTLSPDGRYAIATFYDTSLRLWSTETGAELFRRFVLGENDWIVVAPDGRFDGTQPAIERMHYAQGMQTIALEQFFSRFYTPGLAGLILAGARYDGPDIRTGFLPPPRVRIVSPEPGARLTGTALVAIEAQDEGGGVEDVRLFHNGARVGGATRGFEGAADTQQQRSSCPAGATCILVELLSGTNIFEATAFARDGTESERDRVTVEVEGTLPTASLYVLAVGVDRYENSRYNLNFARADARAFVDSVRAGGRGIFREIVIDTLFDGAATREEIERGFARVAGRAQPHDVFVFYFAGHGTVVDGGDSASFFLVPASVTQMSDADMLRRIGLSDARVRELLEAVPARKKLMIVDACQSGELVGVFARSGAAEERALAQLARSSGVFMMSATDSRQFASEVATLGHGVFTYAILRAMQGTDSRRRERTVLEIIAAAKRLVPELSREHRGSAQYPMVWSNGQDFPLVVQ